MDPAARGGRAIRPLLARPLVGPDRMRMSQEGAGLSILGTRHCNRTFVENRKYVEVLAAVDTPWQGDFCRQEGLTES